jgi:hypothetical protein
MAGILRLDPQNDGAKYRLGRALWLSRRCGEALQNFDRYTIVSFEKALTLADLGGRQAWETIEGVAQQLGRARRGRFSMPRKASRGKPSAEIQVAARLGKDNDHFHHAAFILAAACAEMGKAHQAVGLTLTKRTQGILADLLVTERFDRIEPSGFDGRQHAADDADKAQDKR